MSDQYHTIQRKILSELLFGNKLKYSEIKPSEMEGSQFTFHLNRLIELGLVQKTDDYYTLTTEGKGIANSYDPDSLTPVKQAKHSVVFCALRKIDGRLHTLLYTRKKNPFYNHQGYPTGKVRYGDGIVETAERELFEESGLIGKAELIGVRHFRVYHPTEDLLVEDKVMYVCKIDDPSGEIVNNNEGEFYWVPIEEIKNRIVNPLPEFNEIFNMLLNYDGHITFSEDKHYPVNF